MTDSDFIIKASGVTNLSDARYFASYGIKIIGFCLDPQSPDFMNPFKMKEISGWIEGPKLAGEFNNLSVEAILEAVQSQGLHYAQIKLADISADCAAIDTVPLIIEVALGKENLNQAKTEQLTKIYRADDFVLLDLKSFSKNELNTETVRSYIKAICNKFPVLIDYNFSAENILETIRQFQPTGICLRGSHEIKTGTKSFEDLDELFSLLQKEF